LAIHEIEEGQIGRLSFKGKENVQNVLRPGGIENLQIIVKLQLSHNNALISAISQAHSCFLSSNLAPRKSNDLLAGIIPGSGSKVDDDSKSERKSAVDDPSKIFNLRSIGHGSVSSSSKIITNHNSSSSRLKSYADAFVSIQLEKVNILFKFSFYFLPGVLVSIKNLKYEFLVKNRNFFKAYFKINY
jgi:hypothetical protein